MFDRTAGFYHVLSVFVVLSVSVESAMECQMTCLMKCFLRCVFERYNAVCHVGTTRRKCLRLQREVFSLRRGSKVPAILRDWQEQDAEQAVL